MAVLVNVYLSSCCALYIFTAWSASSRAFFPVFFQVVVPPLPGKAFLRQLPFRGDDGIFDDNFIEERKQGLEQFINK